MFVGGNYLTAAWTYMERPFREAFRRGAAHEAYLASVPVWYTDAADLNLRGLRAISHTL